MVANGVGFDFVDRIPFFDGRMPSIGTHRYYQRAHGALLVFDVSNRESFASVEKWKKDIDSKVLLDDKPIPVVLVANKCDLHNRAVSPAELEAMHQSLGTVA